MKSAFLQSVQNRRLARCAWSRKQKNKENIVSMAIPKKREAVVSIVILQLGKCASGRTAQSALNRTGGLRIPLSSPRMRILTSFSPKSEDMRRERAFPIAPAGSRGIKQNRLWLVVSQGRIFLQWKVTNVDRFDVQNFRCGS